MDIASDLRSDFSYYPRIDITSTQSWCYLYGEYFKTRCTNTMWRVIWVSDTHEYKLENPHVFFFQKKKTNGIISVLTHESVDYAGWKARVKGIYVTN